MRNIKNDIAKRFLIFIGTISWSLTMIKSGWIYVYGMGFWGANGHDGVWHIALSESLAKGSFQMPVFAGHALQNYHIGFDLLLAVLHKVTFIPIVNLYFQMIPPILALLVGILTYKFVFDWTKSEKASLWSVFFTYFGASFGWLLGKGESAFWSQQAISSLINPPFALSVVLLLTGLIFLIKLDQKINFGNSLVCILCFGVLIEIKTYAGILALGGLLVVSIWKILKERNFKTLYVFLGSFALSLLIYLPLNKNASNLLVWQPFWFLETMMGLSDRVGWLKFFSAMTTYKSGHVWIKAIPAYLVAFAIFFVGNFGTRIAFLFKKIKLDQLNIFIYSIIGAGMVIPIFFLQKGTPWNTIQFFYYSLFFSGILAGIAVGRFLENSKLNTTILYSIVVGIVLLTIPTTIITLKDVYIPARPPAKLSNEELQALNFLAKEPDGVVLTYPFDSVAAKMAESNPPRPLYLYASTAYVSAFSNHPTFLEDEMNIDMTGYEWQTRRSQVEAWYKENDQVKAREFLKENNIKYIYWLKGQRARLGETQLSLKNVYENATVIIYQVEWLQN
jgi:hypothetical protein